MHQLCFRKVFCDSGSLENKIKTRPFLEDTETENIDLAINNSACSNNMHHLTSLIRRILLFGIYDKIGEKSGMFWFDGRRGIP